MMSFWKRFSYNRGAVIGLVILTFVIAAADYVLVEKPSIDARIWWEGKKKSE